MLHLLFELFKDTRVVLLAETLSPRVRLGASLRGHRLVALIVLLGTVEGILGELARGPKEVSALIRCVQKPLYRG
jgi:hypothetical protein